MYIVRRVFRCFHYLISVVYMEIERHCLHSKCVTLHVHSVHGIWHSILDCLCLLCTLDCTIRKIPAVLIPTFHCNKCGNEDLSSY